MSDTYIFDNVNQYVEAGMSIFSPSMYLGVGLQPYWMRAAAYEPMAEDAPTLSEENTVALVNSCTTEEQRATLAETGIVDFIADSPYGKYHAYIYAQESGYLLVIISLALFRPMLWLMLGTAQTPLKKKER